MKTVRWFRTGYSAIMICVLTAGMAYAEGQAPAVTTDGTLRLEPAIWVVILSAAVTIGINLGQLARLRQDVRTQGASLAQLTRDLSDNYVRRDYWKERIESIEHGIAATNETQARILDALARRLRRKEDDVA